MSVKEREALQDGIGKPERQKNVGPFVLGRTLGKGSTCKVKLGIHFQTGWKVAIKIITKELMTTKPALAIKIRREIAVMKVIAHPHVVRLYDVFETSKHLYLVMEHIEGGELFDYVLKKRVLEEDEALFFFQQLILGLDYCHKHYVCHRDLKPENLLLDKNSSLKIADFGMASIMRPTAMQETSCGSPHYAAPEVIMGTRYEGAQADVWSSGIILYVLLTGRLPFDDENIVKLLTKVKQGVFTIPTNISESAQHLLSRMLILDPTRRITISGIRQHRWFRKNMLADPFEAIPVPTEVAPSLRHEDELHIEILKTFQALGWENVDELMDALRSPEPSLERILLRMVQQRKLVTENELVGKWGRMEDLMKSRRSRSLDASRLPKIHPRRSDARSVKVSSHAIEERPEMEFKAIEKGSSGMFPEISRGPSVPRLPLTQLKMTPPIVINSIEASPRPHAPHADDGERPTTSQSTSSGRIRASPRSTVTFSDSPTHPTQPLSARHRPTSVAVPRSPQPIVEKSQLSAIPSSPQSQSPQRSWFEEGLLNTPPTATAPLKTGRSSLPTTLFPPVRRYGSES